MKCSKSRLLIPIQWQLCFPLAPSPQRSRAHLSSLLSGRQSEALLLQDIQLGKLSVQLQLVFFFFPLKLGLENEKQSTFGK